MDRIATTPGLFPLSESAKDTLADQKGHQKEDLISGDESPAVTDTYDAERQWSVDVQRDAGLDRLVEGQARWDDMLAHPLCVHENVQTAGIVRYYDNNNFYREPVIEGPLSQDGDIAADLNAAASLLSDDEALQGVLPGPYSLASLASDEYYGDDATLLEALGDFLAEEIAAAPAVETLFVLEPSLVVDPPGDVAEPVSAAIDAIADATSGDVVVQTYWGALDEHTYAHLLDADIEAVGFDLVTPEARDPTVELVREYGGPPAVSLGVVDGQNTAVESPSTIRDRVDWFVEAVGTAATFDRAYVTSNTELFYLPVSRFEAKLDALAAATAEVEA